MTQETKQVIINATMALLLVSMIAGVQLPETPIVHAQNNEVVVSSPTPTANDVTVSHSNTIEEYINYKFGEHADDAFLLLQGNGTKGSCAENKTLNPEAINDNTEWGGIGVDRGYWQINSVYHPTVSDACAKDIKCSTDYAYRMWTNDNESFVRWTCGKHYGI